jgi:hypothetical protein
MKRIEIIFRYLQPLFERNFLVLGREEARDTPKINDIAALKQPWHDLPSVNITVMYINGQ